MEGALPWLVRWACRADILNFCPAFAALVGLLQKFFSSPCTISIHLSPSPSKLGRQSCWVACLLVGVSGDDQRWKKLCLAVQLSVSLNRCRTIAWSVILLPVTTYSQFSKLSTRQFSSFYLLSSTGPLNLWVKKSQIGYSSLPKDVVQNRLAKIHWIKHLCVLYVCTVIYKFKSWRGFKVKYEIS